MHTHSTHSLVHSGHVRWWDVDVDDVDDDDDCDDDDDDDDGFQVPKVKLVACCLFPFIRQFRPIFIQGRRRFHLLCFRHECGELGKIRQVTHVTSAKSFSQISTATKTSLLMEACICGTGGTICTVLVTCHVGRIGGILQPTGTYLYTVGNQVHVPV